MLAHSSAQKPSAADLAAPVAHSHCTGTGKRSNGTASGLFRTHCISSAHVCGPSCTAPCVPTAADTSMCTHRRVRGQQPSGMPAATSVASETSSMAAASDLMASRSASPARRGSRATPCVCRQVSTADSMALTLTMQLEQLLHSIRTRTHHECAHCCSNGRPASLPCLSAG